MPVMFAPLASLTYTSRAKLDLTEGDIGAIMHEALHWNALNGVTGLLLFNGVAFMQVIEGAEDAVDLLYDRLLRDPRHSSVEVRDRRMLEERQFPAWSMELVQVTVDWRHPVSDMDAILPDNVHPANRALILRMAESGEAVRLPG